MHLCRTYNFHSVLQIQYIFNFILQNVHIMQCAITVQERINSVNINITISIH